MKLGVCSAAALAGWLAIVAPARGAALEPAAARFLEWEAPTGCPAGAAVYERARAAAGFAPELGRFQHVRGVVVPADEGWLLTLEFVEAEARHSRSIRAQRCADLEGAAAVALALALGNGLPAPLEAETVADTPTPAPPGDTVRSPALDFAWLGAAHGSIDLQSLQQPSWGVGFDAGVRWAAWQLTLSGLWLPPASSAVRASESVQFWLVALGPRVCRQFSSALALGLCAGLEVGKFGADGGGLSRDAQQLSQWWVAPQLSVQLQQALSRAWSLQLRAEALRPLIQERYTINTTETVYETPELVLRFYLGLGFSSN